LELVGLGFWFNVVGLWWILMSRNEVKRSGNFELFFPVKIFKKVQKNKMYKKAKNLADEKLLHL
jgi:hypothetical protein